VRCDIADCGVENESRRVDAATISTVDAAEEHEEADVKPGVADDGPNNAQTLTNVEVVTKGDASGIAPRDTQEVSGPTNRTTDVDEDIAVKDGEESDVKTATHPQPARSIPPHLRADFQSPAIQQVTAKVR
jgi:hypothetical protein